MVHAHSHTHAARRKKRDLGDFFDWLNPDSHNSDENNDDDGNKTHVVYVTAPATFDGPVGGYVTGTSPDNAAPTVGVGPAVQAKPTETKETAPTTEPHTTKQPPKTKHTSHPTETHPTETHRTETHRTETALPTHITHAKITTDPNAPTTTLATAVSTGTALSLTGLNDASETTSASSSSDKSAESSPTATSVSSGSGSLSGGAKAGIAIGVIAAVGLIAGLILFWLRKKKQSQNLQAEDNEKTFPNHGLAPPGPPPMSEPPKTPVQPPQLNVRPMTQFAPDLSSNNAVAAGAAVGVGSAAAASRNLTSSQPHGMAPPQPSIASGNSQDPFGDPVNPFGNQAEASSPPGAANAMNQSTAPAMGSTETATPADASGASGLGAAAAGAAVAGAAVGLASKSADKDLPHPPETGSSRPESPAASTDAGSVQGAAMAPGAGPGGPGPMNVHRVQMDFNPSMEDELALQSGQLVRLLHEYDDGWALCVRLDRSQQGVAPRSCLSARPVKPRSRPPPGAGPGPRGPPMMGPNGRPMSPGGGRMPPRLPPGKQPRFYPGGPPMSPRPGFAGPPQPPYPQRPMSPGQRPRSPAQRPMSPAQRPMSPAQRPSSPAQRPMSPSQRAISPAEFPAVPPSLAAGPPGRPVPPRSMSPGPYGLPGMQKPNVQVAPRARSNSTGASGPSPLARGPSPPSSLPATPPPTGKLPDLPVEQPTQIQRKPVGDNSA